MTDTAPGRVPLTGVAEHPAMRAWRTLLGGAGPAAGIELLKGRKATARRSACRLIGVGPGGRSVIAKRYPRPKAMLERLVYLEILPHVGVAAPCFHGCVDEADAGSCWLFLEDVGDRRYSAADDEHRRSAGRWLGQLHAAAGELALAERLVDLGPACWLGHVRSARQRVGSRLENAAPTSADRQVLGGVVRILDEIEAHWGRVEALCGTMPRTLVHGDFVAKNVGVRRQGGGDVVLPFDWGQAGWGPPAVDLAGCPPGLGGLGAGVDVTAYWEVVRGYWPGVGLAAVRGWAGVGTLARILMALNWEAASLASQDAVEPVARLGLYGEALSEVLEAGVFARRE